MTARPRAWARVRLPSRASRQELVARVFLGEYLPEVVPRTPLTLRGRVDRD
jgi:hypothetical protein